MLRSSSLRDAVWFTDLPARLISVIGNFLIGLGRSYVAP
jgi:hypothetical protein